MAGSKLVIAALVACWLGAAGTAWGAAVSGAVTFEGEPPGRRPLQMNADPKCAEIHGGAPVLSEEVLVDAQGGLADVFVYVENPPPGPYPPPTAPVELDQKGCLYRPRVQGILLDQTLQITNSDDVLHNVRALAEKNRPFNLGQPPQTPPRTKTFKVVEPALKFKCDVHPWMAAYLFVLDHPFFGVSGPDGSFTIAGLPAGTYTLVAWHEKLGEKTATIEVAADGSGVARFTFTDGNAGATGAQAQ